MNKLFLFFRLPHPTAAQVIKDVLYSLLFWTGVRTTAAYLHAGSRNGELWQSCFFWLGILLSAHSLKRTRKDLGGGAGAGQTVDHNHDLPGAGSTQQEHVCTWILFMDVSLHGQGQPSAVDGPGVHLCGHTSGTTTPCSHHQLWKIAGSEGYITQWDSGTSGAVFGDSVCAGPNRRAEVPAAWATNVLAGHQECYSVCSGLSSVLGGPLFTEWYAPCVVHRQLGYSGNLCAGAERGLPLPEHLCPHRRR